MSDQTMVKKSSTMDDLLRNEFGLRTHPSPESGVKVAGVAVSQILSNNPNRVGLTFLNLGTNNVFLYLDNSVSASKGILLAGGGGTVAFNWRDDMTLITNDWYAVAPGGNTNVQILSVETL